MKHHLLIILILFIALVVRLINYTDSFWLDEAAQAGESCRPLSQQFKIESDFQPPLYHLMVHGLCYFNQSEWWLRLASLIPGLITIFVTILIGQQLHSHHAGYIAGLILSLSQFHAYYSQELRPYSLATMFGVLSILMLLKKQYIYYGIVTALGLYTTYVYWLLPASVILDCLVRRSRTGDRGSRKIFIVTFISILSFIPWLPMFLNQLTIGQNLAASNSVWKTVVSPEIVKSLPLALAKLTLGRIPFDLNASTIIFATTAGLTFGIVLYRSLKEKPFRLLLAVGCLPLALALLISIFVPILDPKRVMYVLPFWSLMLALGIKQNIKSIIALIVLLNISIYALAVGSTHPLTRRENWRQVVADIKAAYQPGDVIIHSFAEPFAPWSWYAPVTMNVVAVSQPSSVFHLLSSLPPRLFVFDYLMDMTDPNRDIYRQLKELGYQEDIVHNYPLIGSVRLMILSPIKVTAANYE